MPSFPEMAEQMKSLTPQLDTRIHDELTQLGNQLELLQTRSPIVPSAQEQMESTAKMSVQESDGRNGTVQGSNAPSETDMLHGQDVVVLEEEDDKDAPEEMEQEEGETEDRPIVPRVKPKPKEGEPKRQFEL